MERHSTKHEFTDAEEKLLVAEQLLNTVESFAVEVEVGDLGLTTTSLDYQLLKLDLIEQLLGVAADRENEANTLHLLPGNADDLPLSKLAAAVNVRMREWYEFGLMEKQKPAMGEFLRWLHSAHEQMLAFTSDETPLARQIGRAVNLKKVRLGTTAGDVSEI